MPSVRVTDFESPITKDHFKNPPDQETAKKLARSFHTFRSPQIVAATAAAAAAFIAEAAGRIVDVRVMRGGAVCAAGESMTFDVLKNGVSVMTAVITEDSATTTADTFRHGTLKTDGTASFVAGDLITFARTYVPGGGPTPLTNTLLVFEWEYESGR